MFVILPSIFVILLYIFVVLLYIFVILSAAKDLLLARSAQLADKHPVL